MTLASIWNAYNLDNFLVDEIKVTNNDEINKIHLGAFASCSALSFGSIDIISVNIKVLITTERIGTTDQVVK